MGDSASGFHSWAWLHLATQQALLSWLSCSLGILSSSLSFCLVLAHSFLTSPVSLGIGGLRCSFTDVGVHPFVLYAGRPLCCCHLESLILVPFPLAYSFFQELFVGLLEAKMAHLFCPYSLKPKWLILPFLFFFLFSLCHKSVSPPV